MQAVLRETELSADTIRVWEKRYALPKPERSAGGHRIYSEYDIETIKWLKTKQTEGMSISRAVDLWREIVESGRDPFSPNSSQVFEPIAITKFNIPIDQIRIQWLEACKAFDQVRANGLLDHAFAIYPVESVCIEIMQRGLHEIGTDWFYEKVSVAQEHFTAALIAKRMESILLATPLPIREQVIVLSGPGGEQHTFPLQLLQLLLMRRGWKVIYLGVDAPADQLLGAIESIKPDLVVFATQTLPAAAALKNVATLLSSSGVPVAYGGLVFNRIEQIKSQIPAWFIGESIEEAVWRIEKLIRDHQVHPGIEKLSSTSLKTNELIRAKHFQIEARVVEQVQEDGFLWTHLKEANSYFSTYLSAALELGSPDYLMEDIFWIRDLLKVKNAPQEALQVYLRIVQKAVKDTLGPDGTDLADWLDTISELH